ncbi:MULTISPECIES: sporulation protein [unclassified Crossiella]|uniref:sporulation protein n=1 Tax=unclassified Crossiella TaxID=2620835 RepID=UPI001FFECD94|nr:MULTISPECIES: sporulation protein [unclassified Crossiella]MCK2244213.1 sporulation protein [Crossiella sp. S99.2]MCK2258017.1 sporulation protein [Crossiella sp. S99.1]
MTLSEVGIGGPSVTTVLDSPHAMPGQPVRGQVRVHGGSAAGEISQVLLSLVTEAESESGPGGGAEYARLVLRDGLRMSAGELAILPFQLPVPWEMPITAVSGAPLPRTAAAIRTELVGPGSCDLDWVQVNPLPAQQRVLDALRQLGFSFRGTGVEAGRVPDLPQELGCYQTLAFAPPTQFTDRIDEVELIFVASQSELCVLLTANRLGGVFPHGDNAFGHFRMSHLDARVNDWAPMISGWLTLTAERGQ